jgi:hypothetical protein
MYSLGLYRLLWRFWQMRIISGRTLPALAPAASCLSMVSRWRSSSFWTAWSSQDYT